MSERSSVRRVSVYKYVQSGRLVGFLSSREEEGARAIDLSPDLRNIVRVRCVQRISGITPTSYRVEIRVTKPADSSSREYELIRTLTEADADSALWLSGAPLSKLPVSPDPDNTKEELLWAGQRHGNIHLGVSLVGSSFLPAAGCIFVYLSSGVDLALYYGLFFLVVSIFTGMAFSWKRSNRPLPEKLQQLAVHKHALRRI